MIDLAVDNQIVTTLYHLQQSALAGVRNNWAWGVSLAIQSFIAYHVFFLSKRISTRDRLAHNEKIRSTAETHLLTIHKEKLNWEVHLVNISRYFKDYPNNDEKFWSGYSHISAEIKAVRFDGIEFIESIRSVYRKKNGRLCLSEKGNERAFKVIQVGIVPYEWIEHVDLRGDDTAYVPQFFCHFKGRIFWQPFIRRITRRGYPYKRFVYYTESDTYNAEGDPPDMKWRMVHERIDRR